jgi:hypothetical protein
MMNIPLLPLVIPRVENPAEWRPLLLVLLAIGMLTALPGMAGEENRSDTSILRASAPDQLINPVSQGPTAAMTRKTNGYEKQALRLVIQEANRVATELHLEEQLPITEKGLVGWYISPPEMARVTKAVGNVATSNYAYYVSIENKFCFLEGMHQDGDRRRWHAQYSWPISLIDTNAAYQLARHWLNAASMDVEGLNQDCTLHIHTYTEADGDGKATRFLPVYWVYWTKGTEGHGSVASVELFAPTKTLMQIRVEDSKYILREPLHIQNATSTKPGSNNPG